MSIEQPLDMHEPRPESQDESGVYDTYTPTEEEEKLVKAVKAAYSKAKLAREPYIERWRDYYHDFRGKQWKQKRPSYRHSEVFNMIFTAIQNQVPLMTDTRPKVDFIATEPNDIDMASILGDLFDSDWERNDWNYVLLETLYDSHIYGLGLGSISFDDQAEFGLGQINWMSLEPMYAYPEPGCTDINQHRKCGYFIYAEPVSLEKIKQTYPEKGRYVKADLQDLWQQTKADLQDVKLRSPADDRPVIVEGKPSYDRFNKDQALVITKYWRPLDVEQEKVEFGEREEDQMTGEVKEYYQMKLKYPKGRKVVVAGNIVLEDSPLDTDDKSIPVQRVINYCDPRSFYGISDIEQLEGPQNTFNKIVSFALDCLSLTGNPIWVVDTDADIDTDNLFNIPGAVIEKNPGSEVRREAGTQLQPYVLQLIDRIKIWFDDISGSQEVTRGGTPAGVTAARAIEALQISSRTRIRQKTRNMDNFLREFGRQYVQYALKNYTIPRVRLVTDDDNIQKYFKFHTERVMLDDEEKTIVHYELLDKDPVTGQMSTVERKETVLSGQFDVRVNTVSGLPFAKAENEQKLFSLFDRGIIDAEELLKGIEYPNADAVLQRIASRPPVEAQQ